MGKKQQKVTLNRRVMWLVAGLAAVAVIGCALVCTVHVVRYNRAAAIAETVTIRELVVQAAEGLMANAPVDPKTGDIYFPQARLYLPATASVKQLTYSYDADTQQLHISDRIVFNRLAAKLYAATNIPSMFEEVPKLQACQRGIHLLPTQPSDKSYGTLKQTITLNNGKVLYAYIEDNCKDLNRLADTLINLQPY